MAINFNELPDNKPNAIPEKGTYYATITKVQMTQGKDLSKPPYLDLTLTLTKENGEAAGKVFDKIVESEHEVVRYKLKRFIQALEIPLTGSFELRDLAKIIINKKLIVDITKEENTGYAPKAVVDVFSNKIYYPMSEASEIFDTPFINAPDADDAGRPSDADAPPENVEY